MCVATHACRLVLLRALRCACLGLIVLGAVLASRETAHAAFIGASASTTVTTQSDGTFLYTYTITNASDAGGPGLLTWAMPFFDDADTSFVGGGTTIFAPDGWTWLFTELTSTTSGDPLWEYVAVDDPKNDTYGAPGTAFENPPYALVFLPDLAAILAGTATLSPIAPGESLGGFGYVSPFSGTNVPFIAAFDNLQLTIGDPTAPRTPTFPAASQVPEPGSLLLFSLGAMGMCVGARRRRSLPASIG